MTHYRFLEKEEQAIPVNKLWRFYEMVTHKLSFRLTHPIRSFVMTISRTLLYVSLLFVHL